MATDLFDSRRFAVISTQSGADSSTLQGVFATEAEAKAYAEQWSEADQQNTFFVERR